jgi:hypothetical protein
MKNWFKIFIIYCLPASLMAQQPGNFVSLIPTEKGIFVHIENPKLLGKNLEIRRKAGSETTFRQVAVLKAPATQTDLQQVITEAQAVFNKENAPDAYGIEKVWQAYRKKQDTLAGFIAGVPQLAYIFRLAYLDKEVKKGTRYQYQILDGQTVLANSPALVFRGNYIFPDLKTMGDTVNARQVVFRFPFSEEVLRHVNFDVKRKFFTDKQTDYKAVKLYTATQTQNKRKFITLTDTSVRALSEYDYQIRMKTIFGESDTALYHFSASNIARRYVAKVSRIQAVSAKDSRALRVSWQIASPKSVQSLALYSSQTFEGKYDLVGNFSPADTAFIYPVNEANELYFFYLELTDIFGNKAKSIKIHTVYEGEHTPTPPAGVSVTPSAKGATLTWQPSDRYTRGFYVYRRQGIQGDFRQISAFLPLSNTQNAFTDSSRLDSRETYYYTLKTESDTHQKSIFSDTVTFRPAGTANLLKPPYDVSATFKDGKVRLSWENMQVQVPEIAGYLVFRKKVGEKEFKQINKQPLTYRQNYFTDSTFFSETDYLYSVISVDNAGNRSMMSLPKKISMQGRFVSVPENLGFDRQSATVKLKWTSFDENRTKTIKIYRAEESGTFKLISTIESSKKNFTDTSVIKGKLYSYRIATIDLEGKESQPSRIVVMSF